MRSFRRVGAVIGAVVILGASLWLLTGYAEHRFLTTAANGPQTPLTFGIPYERVTIASGQRRLAGYLVNAPPSCHSAPAVLVFHGIGETISYWPKAQRFLYASCVSSLVFDYSGHGDSSRPGTVANLNSDAAAAYQTFVSRFPTTARRCVLGHSMGNGPMLAAATVFTPQPSCVVVANAFSSARDLATYDGVPRFVMDLVPDDWDNVINIKDVRAPLLVVSSDADTVVPFAMGRQIFAAASPPKRLLLTHGFRHNALYRNPSAAWWTPVVRFLEGMPARDSLTTRRAEKITR